MEEQFENASEIIFFAPKSQYRWMYEIDGGKKHIIHQDDMLRFIKRYIDKKDIETVSDIMMRHQPFIVTVEDHQVTELHKEEDTLEDQRHKLKDEIDNAIKYGNQSDSIVLDNGDERFKNMTQRFLKL